MMKNYNNYVNNDINYGNIRKNYKKVLKELDEKPEYLYKLDININYFYNIFNSLFNNSGIDVDNYKKMLLIINSIISFIDDDNETKEKFELLIKEKQLNNYRNMSYNVILNLYKTLLIMKKTLRDKILIFESKFLLILISNYIKENNVTIEDFTNMFEDGTSNTLMRYLTKN